MTGLCALVLVFPVLAFTTSAHDAEASAERTTVAPPRDALRHESAPTPRARAAARLRMAAAAKERRLASTRARTPQAVICKVFGQHCREALAVAECESGYRTNAQNGQYLGLFQMGDWARAAYGHGASAHEQAKAAHELFVDTGRTWQPWSCKP